MSDGINEATQAFDVAMGRASAPAARSRKSDDEGGAPEPIFENLGEHLDTSLERAGGDDEGDELAPKPKKAPKEPVELEEDEEDLEEEEEDEEESGEEDEGDEELTEEEREALKAAKKKDGDEDDDDELMDTEFQVMVDGQEKKVKLKEALEGYVRTETFHQRLNQLNEVKTAMTEEAQVIVRDRQKYTDMLKEAEDILAEMMPAEPNWDEEFAKDGVRANQLRKQFDLFKGKVAEIRQKREVAQKEAGDQAVQETTRFAQNEYPKFVKAAGWETRADQDRDTKSMRKTALALGFSQDEIGRVYDSRLLQVLLKASKYDRMMASRPKPIRNAKTVDGKQQVSLGAGRNISRTAPKGMQAAMSRLNKTGSLDDAAGVFDKILSNSRKQRNR
jgi:hypothetical protein